MCMHELALVWKQWKLSLLWRTITTTHVVCVYVCVWVAFTLPLLGGSELVIGFAPWWKGCTAFHPRFAPDFKAQPHTDNTSDERITGECVSKTSIITPPGNIHSFLLLSPPVLSTTLADHFSMGGLSRSPIIRKGLRVKRERELTAFVFHNATLSESNAQNEVSVSPCFSLAPSLSSLCCYL